MTFRKSINLICILAAAVSLTGCIGSSSAMTVSSFENGKLYNDGGINVIELNGDWHTMGRQYGALAKGYISDMLAYLDTRMNGDHGRKERAYAISDSLFLNYPAYLKDFFAGMEETSGIAMKDLKLCNAAEYVEECFFCSAIAVWGGYSENGLIMGRNYDAVSYSEVCRNIVLTVYHPDEGLSIATLGYAGEIYCVNGINEKGIFVELNNGMPSAGWDVDWKVVPSTTSLFQMLLSAKTMQDVDDFFSTTASFASFAIGVASGSEARVYEWCRKGVKRGDAVTPEGLMISTNHYANPEWESPVPEDADSWNSISRRDNLLHSAEKYKGSIDLARIKEMISTPIEKGGAYHDLTRYQIVAIPSTLTLHIKLPINEDWVEINLSRYLTQ